MHLGESNKNFHVRNIRVTIGYFQYIGLSGLVVRKLASHLGGPGFDSQLRFQT